MPKDMSPLTHLRPQSWYKKQRTTTRRGCSRTRNTVRTSWLSQGQGLVVTQRQGLVATHGQGLVATQRQGLVVTHGQGLVE